MDYFYIYSIVFANLEYFKRWKAREYQSGTIYIFMKVIQFLCRGICKKSSLGLF